MKTTFTDILSTVIPFLVIVAVVIFIVLYTKKAESKLGGKKVNKPESRLESNQVNKNTLSGMDENNGMTICSKDFFNKLDKLKNLFKESIYTENEYLNKKNVLISELEQRGTDVPTEDFLEQLIPYKKKGIITSEDISLIKKYLDRSYSNNDSYSNNNIENAELISPNDNIEENNIEPVEVVLEKDQKCDNCNEEIELNEQEIIKGKYVCPKCSKVNTTNAEQKKIAKRLSGIRGMLVLPAIGLIFGFSNVFNAIMNLSPQNPLYSKIPDDIILFTYIKSGLLFIFLLVLAINFFRKKKSAPALYIGFLITNATLYFVELSIIKSYLTNRSYVNTEESISAGIGIIFASLFWIIYFINSKRVKATFVN